MTDDVGQNESRTLDGGEIVYLVKDPGAKWRIRFYECHHAVVDGLIFTHLQVLPEDWKDLDFETLDEAVEFVQQQIREGTVPGNIESA